MSMTTSRGERAARPRRLEEPPSSDPGSPDDRDTAPDPITADDSVPGSAPGCRPEWALLGDSPAVHELRDIGARVAPTALPVLLVGEAGTGKDMIGRWIHERSHRACGPFIRVNCAVLRSERNLVAMDEYRRATRDRLHPVATLFLENVTDTPGELQPLLEEILATGRLGRALPNALEVRVVATCREDPEHAMTEGRLAEELLYRVSVLPVVVPPLRERGEDARVIARHVLAALCEDAGALRRFSTDALEWIAGYGWPGNVRQLINRIQRAFVLGEGDITPDQLMPSTRPAASAPTGAITVRVGTPLCEVERRVILATLAQQGGNKRAASRVLGMSVKTLYNRLRAYRAAGHTIPGA